MKEKYHLFKVKARKLLNQNENTIIFIGLIFFGLGLYIIDNKNNNPNVNKFNAEVWGTVSDWYMVIVTLITAIFLYKTLKSQKDVQKEQNRLFKIEELKYLYSIKPKVNLTIFSTSQFDNDDYLYQVRCVINFSIENGELIRQRINVRSKFKTSRFKYSKIKDKIFNLMNTSPPNNEANFEVLAIEVFYKDLHGNEYTFKEEVINIYDIEDGIQTLRIPLCNKLVKPVY